MKHNAKRCKNALLWVLPSAYGCRCADLVSLSRRHVQLYLQIYHPTSRIEIWRTNRYTEVSGHTELAIYATSPLAKDTILTELQGSCATLPDEWREDMEYGNWGDSSGAEEEGGPATLDIEDDEVDGDDEEDGGDDDDNGGTATPDATSSTSPRKALSKEKDLRRRRSHRTGRRDFSIIWSERRRHYQLFLGPARFLNHDCEPNVSLYRAENGRVTFMCLRDIRIGEELTTC